jgi:hypothetical protein
MARPASAYSWDITRRQMRTRQGMSVSPVPRFETAFDAFKRSAGRYDEVLECVQLVRTRVNCSKRSQ